MIEKETKKIKLPAIHFMFKDKTENETLEYYKNMYNTKYEDGKLKLIEFEDVDKFTKGIIFCKDVFIFKNNKNEKDNKEKK